MGGHVARIEEMRNSYEIFVSKPERDQLENIGVDGKIIVEWV
jgi:hypothetical protein